MNATSSITVWFVDEVDPILNIVLKKLKILFMIKSSHARCTAFIKDSRAVVQRVVNKNKEFSFRWLIYKSICFAHKQRIWRKKYLLSL